MKEEKGIPKFSTKSWHYKLQVFVLGEGIKPRSLCPYFWTTMMCLGFFPIVLTAKLIYWGCVAGFKGFMLATDWYFERKYINWAKTMTPEEFYKYIEWDQGEPLRFDWKVLGEKESARVIWFRENNIKYIPGDGVQKEDFDKWRKIKDEAKILARKHRDEKLAANYQKVLDQDARSKAREEKWDKILAPILPKPKSHKPYVEPKVNDEPMWIDNLIDWLKKNYPGSLAQKIINKTFKIIFGIIMWTTIIVAGFFIVGFTARFLIWVYEVTPWMSVGLWTLAILIVLVIIFIAGFFIYHLQSGDRIVVVQFGFE